MAFGVRQWPVAPDPRTSFYSFEGWNWGQVSPFKFVLGSTNATGIYSWLNDGLVLPSIFDSGTHTQWGALVPGSAFALASVSKVGHPAPVMVPPRTISFNLLIVGLVPVLDAVASELLIFPDAIRVFGPWDLTNALGPIAEVPDGVTITPAIWNFELP